MSKNVSAVSAEPAVRAVLTKRQRAEARKGNVVLEGRDMGTVVVPDAEVKVFLTASVQERARRRQAQLEAQGVAQSTGAIGQGHRHARRARFRPRGGAASQGRRRRRARHHRHDHRRGHRGRVRAGPQGAGEEPAEVAALVACRRARWTRLCIA